MKTTRRRLLRSGILGAVIAIVVEIAVLTNWPRTDVNGAEWCVIMKRLFLFVHAPCGWLINWLVRGGIIAKHDGISCMAVFIIYFALIGAVLGVGIGLLVYGVRKLREAKQAVA